MPNQHTPTPRRPILIVGDLAYITLTQNYVAVIYARHVHLVDKWNWCVMGRPGGGAKYAVRRGTADGGRRWFYLHRVIMDAPDGLFVDHIDGDGLNNRLSNLRFATGSQNQHNTPIRKDNTSGFKGVWWEKRRGKWRAQIRLDNKNHQLGRYPTPELAHAAYAEANTRMHGAFGRTV